ncbi:MAG: ribonuclease J [Candidatus Sungbacteria bacterium]|uniref:Ribonuclease J n=1 Tax=Candidatus Sungiibacteriota bacterium TaxID=2750080 RepID=A0A932R172_9BACT|nr:ribonuclease J [Candidatus Sungbacteria bacterium]
MGGCGEVTRSCYVYEYNDDIVIVDMGLQFPDEDMPGIDYLIPNIEYLKSKKKNIRGVIITHGHYDHIGAIPHLLDALGNPMIYATALTRGVIVKRQEDFSHVARPRIEVVTPDSRIRLGSFDVEFFHVNHNIPDSVGIVLKTPAGTVVHTGDWKFDHTPVNERPADIARLTQLGAQGVTLLVSESTDAEHAGHQISETEVQKSLEVIFQAATGRIIAATFSSLLTRIQQLIWLSEKYGRKVAIEGPSMKEYVAVSQALGYMKIKRGTLIEAKAIGDHPEDQVTIICTGAQGEDRAVLMRIANNEHKSISLRPADSIIFSSSVIPGNEATVQRLKDVLYKKAAHVYHYATMDIHAGGHAKRDELKQMIELTRPTYFIPIHGTYFMLKLHTKIAEEAGLPTSNIVIAEDGDIVAVSPGEIKMLKEKAPTDHVMVDGLGVGDVKEVVLRDRQHLAGDGIFVIIAIVDSRTGKVRTSPDIISRGFIYLKESQDLLKEVRNRTRRIVEEITVSGEHPINWTHIKDNLREKVGQFLFQKTQRRPMVLPVVIEV